MRILALAAALPLAAGCGGDERETAPSAPRAVTTAPAQTDWAEKADAVCVAYQARIDALPAPQTAAEAVTVIRDTVTLARDELRALERLTPPPSQRVLVRRFLAQLRRLVAATEGLGAATRRGDQAGQAAALALLERAGAEAQRLADRLGLTACGAEAG